MKELFESFSKGCKIAFFVCLAISIALIVTSFIIPPTGVIDPSVLKATGELMGFAALSVIVIGIERGGDVSIRHHDTEVKINNPDND